MTKELVSNEWYEALIEECRSQPRMTLVEKYHTVGKKLIECYDKSDRSRNYRTHFVRAVARSLGKSPKTVYGMIRFAKQFPDWELVPKGISWRVLCNGKEHIDDDLRWEVWERDNFTCRNCGVRRHLSIDHIVPESHGGRTEIDNLQTLCKRCNCSKGAREYW